MTHSKMLISIINYKKINTIVELGMGFYSTKLFINNCSKVISIEMQSEKWFETIVKNFGENKNWIPLKLIGPFKALNFNYPDKIDLVFIDGHGNSRPDFVNLMMKKRIPIIVAHDTEEPDYRWDKIINTVYYFKIEYKEKGVGTICWTINKKLYNYLKKVL